MSLPTKPGNAERGWNDPPMFLHNPDGAAASVATPPKRTPLNKRVAYPADSAPSKTASPMSVAGGPPPMLPPPSTSNNLPPNQTNQQPGGATTTTASPMDTIPPSGGVVLLPPTTTTDIPKFTAPIIVPNMNHIAGAAETASSLPILGSPTATNPITNAQVNVVDAAGDELGIPNFDDDTQMFHYTMSKLRKTLLDVQDRLQPKVVEVIQKKLEILSSMWQSGSISYEVKSSMARLATALHKRRCDTAHDIHMSLMMDFVSEVGQWMVGVKRLIQEARGVEAPLSPTDTTVPVANPSINERVSAENTETSVPKSSISNTDTGVKDSATGIQESVNVTESDKSANMEQNPVKDSIESTNIGQDNIESTDIDSQGEVTKSANSADINKDCSADQTDVQNDKD